LAVRVVKSIVAASILSFAAYRAGNAALHARLLQVDRIVVQGTERLSAGEVLAVVDGLKGQNIVWTDLGEWRDRLLASPWVADASLKRSLPSTVDIAISEREPIGVARIDGDLYLVDQRAVVIDQYGPRYADLDLPIIDGLTRSDGSAAAPAEAHAELAARLISSLGTRPEIADRISQIDVGNVHNAAVILNGDPAVIYLGEDRFAARLQSYLELADALRERVPAIDYVDLRFDARIYVRPSGTGRDKAQVVRR
jgi:cell division protein FtsQ